VITKILHPATVQQAVDQEMELWNKQRSDIGVANAERRATLRQAQHIYDAAKSLFEAARESNRALLERVRANYELVAFMEDVSPDCAIAVEEYCDLVMMSMNYPDEICCNWVLKYFPDSRSLHILLDLPSLAQLDLPKSWSYSNKDAEVVEHRFTESELAELCDDVSYQMVMRTMYDLFLADEAGVLDSITCNGEVAVQSPSSAEATSYVVLSVSANKQDVLALDIANELPNQLFEQLGGVSAGAPHLVMPVEPVA
jgi:restriction system protein